MAIRPDEIDDFTQVLVKKAVTLIDDALKANWSSEKPKPFFSVVLWENLPVQDHGSLLDPPYREAFTQLEDLYTKAGWKVKPNEGHNPKATPTSRLGVCSPSLTFSQ